MSDARSVFVARNAMATRFEIVLHGNDAANLRAAGEEALDEIDRLEAQLSLYRATSELARLNASAHRAPVRVSPLLFQLLQRSRDLSQLTRGAFDVTVAPLVRCWGFLGSGGRFPDPEQISRARELVGMNLVELNASERTVRFLRDGVMIDLGGIGKGLAIDRAAELLREAGVTSALIHGGTSSSCAIGMQPDGGPWKVAITSSQGEADAPLAVVTLQDESLSVSAVWGKSFAVGETTFGHVIDPRSGSPTDSARLAAVILPSATDGDALSTALLTDPEVLPSLAEHQPQLRCLVARAKGQPAVMARGIEMARKTFESTPGES